MRDSPTWGVVEQSYGADVVILGSEDLRVPHRDAGQPGLAAESPRRVPGVGFEPTRPFRGKRF